MRVSSPEQLQAKIAYFESKPEQRIKLVRYLQSVYCKPYLDGRFLEKHINACCLDCDLISPFEVEE